MTFGTVVFRAAFVKDTSKHRTRKRMEAFEKGVKASLGADPLDLFVSPSSETLFYFELGREQKRKESKHGPYQGSVD